MWTQAEAIGIARKVEEICPKHGYHVALTGGCLYKDGDRKDCDLLFYRIRQCQNPDHLTLFEDLEAAGILRMKSGWGWCIKAETMEGKLIDCFFPEEVSGGDYVGGLHPEEEVKP